MWVEELLDTAVSPSEVEVPVVQEVVEVGVGREHRRHVCESEEKKKKKNKKDKKKDKA